MKSAAADSSRRAARSGTSAPISCPRPPRGQPPPTAPDDARRVRVGDWPRSRDGEALKAYIKQNDWNQFHVIARGNMLVHIINGHVTALFLDDDPASRAMKGLIGLQIHVGPPMKIEFRNIYLKTL